MSDVTISEWSLDTKSQSYVESLLPCCICNLTPLFWCWCSMPSSGVNLKQLNIKFRAKNHQGLKLVCRKFSLSAYILWVCSSYFLFLRVFCVHVCPVLNRVAECSFFFKSPSPSPWSFESASAFFACRVDLLLAAAFARRVDLLLAAAFARRVDLLLAAAFAHRVDLLLAAAFAFALAPRPVDLLAFALGWLFVAAVAVALGRPVDLHLAAAFGFAAPIGSGKFGGESTSVGAIPGVNSSTVGVTGCEFNPSHGGTSTPPQTAASSKTPRSSGENSGEVGSPIISLSCPRASSIAPMVASTRGLGTRNMFSPLTDSATLSSALERFLHVVSSISFKVSKNVSSVDRLKKVITSWLRDVEKQIMHASLQKSWDFPEGNWGMQLLQTDFFRRGVQVSLEKNCKQTLRMGVSRLFMPLKNAMARASL